MKILKSILLVGITIIITTLFNNQPKSDINKKEIQDTFNVVNNMKDPYFRQYVDSLRVRFNNHKTVK